MPRYFDPETGRPVDASAEQLQQAYLQGQAGFKPGQRVHVVAPDGTVGSVDAGELDQSIESGFRIADDVEVEKARLLEEHGSGIETAKAGAEAVARGTTLGLSDMALTETGLVDPEDLAARQEANPGVALAGEVAGGVAPLLLSGGASAGAQVAARGAAAAGRGGLAAARAGQAVRAAGALPRATVAAGKAVERGAEALLGSRAATLSGRLAKTAAGGATEGAIVGAGQAVSRAAIDDHDLTAEQLIAYAADGAMLGGGASAGLVGAGHVARRTAERAVDLAPERVKQLFSADAIKRHLDEVQGRAAARAAKGPGGGKALVERAEEELGGLDDVGNRLLKHDLITTRSTIDDIAEATANKTEELRTAFYDNARRTAPEAVDAAENTATFSALSGGKKYIKNAKRHGGVQEVGSRLRKLGVVRRESDLQGIHGDAIKVNDELGERIGEVMRRVDENDAITKPSNLETHQRIQSRVLAPMKRSGSLAQKRVANTIRKELESRGLMRPLIKVEKAAKSAGGKPRIVKELAEPVRFTYSELHQARGALQREMGKFDSATNAALTDGYRKASREVERLMEDLLEFASKRVDDPAIASYQELKKDFAATALARDATEDALQSQVAKADPDLQAPVRKAFAEADEAVEAKFDEMVQGAPDREQLLELKRDYQAVRWGRDASEEAVGRAGANRMLSMSDMQVAQSVGIGDAMAFGVDPGTLALAFASGLAHKFMRTRGAAFAAGSMQSLRNAQQATREALDIERATDSAVKRFFEKGKRVAKSAPRAIARQAVARSERPKLTRQERYDKLVAELQEKDDEQVADTAATRLTDTDEMTTAAYSAAQLRALQFLRSKKPRDHVSPGLAQPDVDKLQRVSDSEQERFLRYAEAVRDPMSVIRGIEEGDITREGVEAMSAVYPRMYETLVMRVEDMVQRAEEPLPYGKLVQLSTVLQRPMHPSMAPRFILSAQRVYQPEQPQRTDAVVSPSAASAPDLAKHHMTETQALESGG